MTDTDLGSPVVRVERAGLGFVGDAGGVALVASETCRDEAACVTQYGLGTTRCVGQEKVGPAAAL